MTGEMTQTIPAAHCENLASSLDRSASRHPDRTALVAGGRSFTFAQLAAASNQVAHFLLSVGVRPGERVALACPNVPQFAAMYYGILRVGAVVVPLNILLKAREVAYQLEDSGAVAFLAFHGSGDVPVGAVAKEAFDQLDTCTSLFVVPEDWDDAPWADQASEPVIVDRSSDQTAVVLFTSGTTGQAKGAELTHANLVSNVAASREVFAMDSDLPDVALCVLPLYHSFGQTCVLNAMVTGGGTIVLQPKFEAGEAFELMARHEVTFFAGVPTMYWGLLAAIDGRERLARRAADRLRVAVSGGAALPQEIHREVRDRLGLTVLEGYGLSETSPVSSFARVGETPRVGSVGRPVPGVEMKLVQDDWSDIPDDPEAVGEIAVRGPNVMKGYLGRPEATAEVLRDGWFRTGDLGRRDVDGFYSIVDRKKSMILRGGFNVYPRELEEVLMAHPAVSLVAVVGVPHPRYGEEVKAVVVRVPGVATSSEAIIEWGRARMASYKYPRIVEFRDSLPMTSTGKILKRAID